MKKTTLVVMAAGIGSRFGGGIKQLEPVGPSGEIIMDYSIHDALEAGFNKVVFIIRKDLEKDFREVIGNRMEKIVETAYACLLYTSCSGLLGKKSSAVITIILLPEPMERKSRRKQNPTNQKKNCRNIFWWMVIMLFLHGKN